MILLIRVWHIRLPLLYRNYNYTSFVFQGFSPKNYKKMQGFMNPRLITHH